MDKAMKKQRGFTLIELIGVIVVLAVLAGVALPKYFDHAARAKVAACKGALGGVRTGVANFYANAAIGGDAAYPTLTQLTDGSTMQEDIPDNPYDSSANAGTVYVATSVEAAARTVPVTAGTGGWAFYFDNTEGAETYVFYANTDTTGVDENAF